MAKRAVHGIFVNPRYTHLINAVVLDDAYDCRGRWSKFVPRFVSEP